jgi:hypothetical protein
MRMFQRAAAAVWALATAARGAGLVDSPIVADAVQYLDGEGWTASNGVYTVGARVPGDLLTDLQGGGLIGDPLFELNFQTTLHNQGNWSYVANFDVANPAFASAAQILLVFDGIKMV